VGNLSSGIRRPSTIGQAQTQDLASRRLLDAKLNFGVGNYDDAAVVLYDFVEKNPGHPAWDEGLYYLGEALFQKGDFVASKTYFIKLIDERGTRSRYYQQGLERLIELTLKLDDSSEVDKWLAALDNVPAAQLRDSVPYVRGKYAYFRDQFDDALAYFAKVPGKSEYYAQSLYFTGVCHVAKKDLGPASEAFKKLSRRKANTTEEKRILELTYMALGRLYYERDQPSKSVDSYLRISRRSDLFDEALYEVAWVYVKNKEFDKALRALELLALADPTSQKLPDVKILEGNLRIRKAQRIASEGKGNSKEEYDKALNVFETTKTTFKESHDQLKELMEQQVDAQVFLAQITGRNSETFDVHAALPEVAAAWLRQQPEVARVVTIETDLGQISDEIREAESTIARLESAINTPSKVNIFPSLAEKRVRSTEILEEVFSIRAQLATHERALVSKYANASQKSQLKALQERRQKLAKELESGGGKTESERIGQARARFTELDKRAAEVSTVIDATEAQLVALEKYVQDQGSEIKPEEVAKIDKEMKSARMDVDTMRAELKDVRRLATLAKDRAGTGDEEAAKRKALRAQLRQALEDEHRFLQGLHSQMSGGDRGKAQQISTLTQKSNSITLKLDEVNDAIDAIVDDALSEVRSSLSEEKAKLSAYRREFLNYEGESRTLGGEVLGLSFEAVVKRFYQILVRSDVGVVDVAWSLKEAAENHLSKLNLDQARERRQLDSDFADVIQEIRERKAAELQGGGNQ
jgi:tetratricopeptide (TPR) repeat protein